MYIFFFEDNTNFKSSAIEADVALTSAYNWVEGTISSEIFRTCVTRLSLGDGVALFNQVAHDRITEIWADCHSIYGEGEAND